MEENKIREQGPDETKKNPHKFYSIPYLKGSNIATFSPADEVWIEEKIDGTNVSCEIDENNQFRCYGRRYELGAWYTNNKAYEKLLELEDIIRAMLSSDLVLYFEYLTRHHVKYSEDKVNKLYLIAVKDKTTNKYLIPTAVRVIAQLIGVETPPLLYHGLFKDWSIAKSLVGTSEFGAEVGEGVIVKARDTQYGTKMIKIVGDDFKEVMKYDSSRVQAKLNKEQERMELVKTIVTEARIRKLLLTMRDENLITSVNNISSDDKKVAIKNIGKSIYADCIKEEPDTVNSLGKDFSKYAFLVSKQYIERL